MKRSAALAGALAALCLRTAAAGPADYVYSPAVEYGERELDIKFGSASRKGDTERKSAGSIGFGYGATERWFSEIYLKYQKEGDGGTKYDALEWENKFQFTEPGEFPIDVGLITELERPRDRAEGYEFRWGPLFQTDFGRLQLNANLLFERSYRAESPSHAEMGYQFQAKYRWRQEFEFGLQAFGEMGRWRQWSPAAEQTHRVGPAVFGKIPLGGRQAIRYNAAFLFGTTSATPDRTFRFQTEYEF